MKQLTREKKHRESGSRIVGEEFWRVFFDDRVLKLYAVSKDRNQLFVMQGSLWVTRVTWVVTHWGSGFANRANWPKKTQCSVLAELPNYYLNSGPNFNLDWSIVISCYATPARHLESPEESPVGYPALLLY
jgi:hypothetical protein